MKIVGHCPYCGAPIYGHEEVYPSGEIIIRYSCDCRKNRNAESTKTPGAVRVMED